MFVTTARLYSGINFCLKFNMKYLTSSLPLFLAFGGTALAFSCAKLSRPSTVCKQIDYNTNITDITAADDQVRALVDKISREGVGAAGADCFQALQKAACYVTFRKCNPETNTFFPVCMTVRNSALNICETSGSFTDSNIIEENLDSSLFQQLAGKCYPDYSNEAPIVEGDATVNPPNIPSPELEDKTPVATENPSLGDISGSPKPSESKIENPTSSDSAGGPNKNATGASDKGAGIEEIYKPPQDLAYSFSSSVLATFVALCGVAVLCSIPVGVIYLQRKRGNLSGGLWDTNPEYKRINLENDSVDLQYESTLEPPEPHVEMENFFIEDEEFGEFSGGHASD
ncbi:hypothetical protein K7432_007480 [Basidiobolus ranarum]|uniref:Uncharacterized protein n=1 Tax=Basidiobolus ranarum TaxID=34480 RepID=A0ABR2W009_9FUNG